MMEKNVAKHDMTKLLVVESRSLVRKTIVDFLNDYEYHHSTNSVEAVESFRNITVHDIPDVIAANLVDLMSFCKDNSELCNMIKKNSIVIAYHDSSDPFYRKAASNLGIEQFVESCELPDRLTSVLRSFSEVIRNKS